MDHYVYFLQIKWVYYPCIIGPNLSFMHWYVNLKLNYGTYRAVNPTMDWKNGLP